MNKLEVQDSGKSSDALNSSHDFIPTKDDKEKGNEDTPRQKQSTSVASLSIQQLQLLLYPSNNFKTYKLTRGWLKTMFFRTKDMHSLKQAQACTYVITKPHTSFQPMLLIPFRTPFRFV